jgi:capsular exopolysaccharide synthesis family protein
VLAAALLALIELLDTRVRDPDEVADLLGTSLLGSIPPPPARIAEKPGLVLRDGPSAPSAEATRMVRSAIEFANVIKRARTIMISSASPGEGKTTTAGNLALSFAQSGKRVALVDLDLRRPTVYRLFAVDPRPGVTGLVVGRGELDSALLEVDIHGLDVVESFADGHLSVLPAGEVPPNPSEFVEADALKELVESLKRTHDLVIVDTPPMLAVSDTLVLSGWIEAVVLVARLHEARRPVMLELRRMLDRSPVTVLGVVATGIRESDQEYGQYGYGPADGLDPAVAAPPTRERERQGLVRRIASTEPRDVRG